MKSFNHSLIIRVLVSWDAQESQHDRGIVQSVHGNVWGREWHVSESSLHALRPLFHQQVEVRHLLSVVDCGWGFRLVDVCHVDPREDFFGVFVGILNRLDRHFLGSNADRFLELDVLHLEYSVIRAVHSWLVEDRDAEVFFFLIWLWHLEEGIDLSYCRDVIWNEWLEKRVQLNVLRFEPANVFKELLDILVNLEASVVGWVVGTRQLL